MESKDDILIVDEGMVVLDTPSDILDEFNFQGLDEFEFEDTEDYADDDFGMDVELEDTMTTSLIVSEGPTITAITQTTDFLPSHVKENYAQYVEISGNRDRQALMNYENVIKRYIGEPVKDKILRQDVLFIVQELSKIPEIDAMSISLAIHQELVQSYVSLKDLSMQDRMKKIKEIKDRLYKQVVGNYMNVITQDGSTVASITESQRLLMKSVTDKICDNIDAIYLRNAKQVEIMQADINKELKEISHYLSLISVHEGTEGVNTERTVLTPVLAITKNYIVTLCGNCGKMMYMKANEFLTSLIMLTEEETNSDIITYITPFFCSCNAANEGFLLNVDYKSNSTETQSLVPRNIDVNQASEMTRNVIISDFYKAIQDVVEERIIQFFVLYRVVKSRGTEKLVYKPGIIVLREILEEAQQRVNSTNKRVENYFRVFNDQESKEIEERIEGHFQLQSEEDNSEVKPNDLEKSIVTMDFSNHIKEYLTIKNIARSNRNSLAGTIDRSSPEYVAKALAYLCDTTYHKEMEKAYTSLAYVVNIFSNLFDLTSKQKTISLAYQFVKYPKRIEEKRKILEMKRLEKSFILNYMFSRKDILFLKKELEMSHYEDIFSDEEVKGLKPLAQVIVLIRLISQFCENNKKAAVCIDRLAKSSRFDKSVGAIKNMVPDIQLDKEFITKKNCYISSNVKEKISSHNLLELCKIIGTDEEKKELTNFVTNEEFCCDLLGIECPPLIKNTSLVFRQDEIDEDYFEMCKHKDTSLELLKEASIYNVSSKELYMLLNTAIVEMTCINDSTITSLLLVDYILKNGIAELVDMRSSVIEKMINKQQDFKSIAESNKSRLLAEIFFRLEYDDAEIAEVLDPYKNNEVIISEEILDEYSDEITDRIEDFFGSLPLSEDFFREYSIDIENKEDILLHIKKGVNEVNALYFAGK